MSFTDLTGQTLFSAPGSINGVYILDYSSEVEVTNCSNCQIFIGPVDGPAIFDSCTNCQVAVACQQFQAKTCERIEFGLYCATQPSLSGCAGITISCWAGAYPGLSAHFLAANLDPKANHWNKVYDASAEEGAPPNFELVEGRPAQYWEVPLEGQGPCEDPVPAADGSLYQPGGAEAGLGDFAEAAPAPAPVSEPLPENGFTDDFLAEPGMHPEGTVASGMLEPAQTGEHPRVSAARQKLQQRLSEQSQYEAEQKGEIVQTAGKYLESFYEKRNQARDERIKATREQLEGRGRGERAPEGSNEWERISSIIDFNFTRPNGTDLSRFKSVLFACKAKGSVPAMA
ncbi:hypothetical protein N2152v2_006840 [Parachlorella kessleri]